MSGPGLAWRGAAGPGRAWRGKAWTVAGLGLAWLGAARRGWDVLPQHFLLQHSANERRHGLLAFVRNTDQAVLFADRQPRADRIRRLRISRTPTLYDARRFFSHFALHAIRFGMCSR